MKETATTRLRIIVQDFYPSNQAMAIRLKHLADAMLSKGFEVSVLCTQSERESKPYTTRSLRSPKSSNRDNTYVRLAKEILVSIEVFLRILVGKPYTYLISSPPFTLASAAALACRIRRFGYMFDVRDEYPDVYFSERLVSEKSWIGRQLRKVEAANYKSAILVSTVTSPIMATLAARMQDKSKLHLVRNGYASSIKWNDQYLTDPFTVMFHGNLGKFQAPEIIVALAKRCSEEELPIIFKVYGWGAQASVIETAAKRLPNLHFLGEVPHEDMPSILKQATVGISFQGSSEISARSFPSKVMEFIGTGIPVLLTPMSEAGDFLEAHQIGKQFSPDDIASIFETIKRWHKDHNHLHDARQRMQGLRNELSREHISRAYVEVLSPVLTRTIEP
jgi:glycosyltransferase involved in cell wall biosynthesis